MPEFSVGDIVRHRDAPFTVRVESVGKCSEHGCEETVIGFSDPMTGEPDEYHASFFVSE